MTLTMIAAAASAALAAAAGLPSSRVARRVGRLGGAGTAASETVRADGDDAAVGDAAARDASVRGAASRWSARGAGQSGEGGARAGGGVAVRRALGAAGVGLLAALLLGGRTGWVVGTALAVVSYRRLARGGRGTAADDAAAAAALPLALDLLGACFAAGLDVATALAAVVPAVPATLGRRLRPALTAARLGAGPVETWRALAEDPLLAPAARALRRAGATGAPSAALLRALAARQREEVRADYARRAQAVGVRAVAPLSLCFLPAFMLVSVVPAVWGLAGGLLSSFGAHAPFGG